MGAAARNRIPSPLSSPRGARTTGFSPPTGNPRSPIDQNHCGEGLSRIMKTTQRGHDVVGYDDAMSGVPGAQWLSAHAAGANLVLRGNSLISVFMGAGPVRAPPPAPPVAGAAPPAPPPVAGDAPDWPGPVPVCLGLHPARWRAAASRSPSCRGCRWIRPRRRLRLRFLPCRSRPPRRCRRSPGRAFRLRRPCRPPARLPRLARPLRPPFRRCREHPLGSCRHPCPSRRCRRRLSPSLHQWPSHRRRPAYPRRRRRQARTSRSRGPDRPKDSPERGDEIES